MSHDLIQFAQVRDLVRDIEAGSTYWTERCLATKEIWNEYKILQRSGRLFCRQNGLAKVKSRAAKESLRQKTYRLMKRLDCEEDLCIDLVGDGGGEKMIGHAELERRVRIGMLVNKAFTSPWSQVSTMTRYWGAGDVIVLCGLSGAGKTNVSLQMSCFAGYKTIYFGTDMSDKGIGKRLWEIGWYRDQAEEWHSGDERKACFFDMMRAIEQDDFHLPENIMVWDHDVMSLEQIEFEATKQMELSTWDVLIIDYAGRIESDHNSKDAWRDDQKIARGIKGMAKRLKIRIIVLCQFNATAERFKKPSFNWLSGSKELISASDLVLCVWQHKADGGEDVPDESHILISDDIKNRDAGSHGNVRLNRFGLWLTQDTEYRDDK